MTTKSPYYNIIYNEVENLKNHPTTVCRGYSMGCAEQHIKLLPRQIGKEALKNIKHKFNNGMSLNEINFDNVIKDRKYLKIKARRVWQNNCGMFGHTIEQRCSNGRMLFGGYM